MPADRTATRTELPSQPLAICATFTAEPLEPTIRFWCRSLDLELAPSFAPYGQVFQQLLDPTSALSANRKGVGLLLLRLVDFLRDQPAGAPAASLERHLREVHAQLLHALTEHARRASAPLLVALPPSAPWSVPAGLGTVLDELSRALGDHLAGLPPVTLLARSSWERYSPGEPFDREQDALAHVPYTPRMFAALATAAMRSAHALLVPAHKVVALDCDNTLWKGVVGEDGPRGLQLPPGFERLQRWAVEQQKQGTMLCLCSKNAEADVLQAFVERPDFPLRPEHIVAHRINWSPKSQNLASLARELNVGVDSFVFLDDNPVECAEVEAALPQVCALQVPPPEEVEPFLDHLWALDRARITEEDRRRTEMYRQNAARQQFEATAPTLDAFLAGLDLSIDSGPLAEDEWPRAAQLTQRTNQFNATTVRRTEAEMRTLASGGAVVLRQRVKDRFGDYGLVGLLVLQPGAGELLVETFLLSCRVLGRGVEHAMLRQVAEEAGARGLEHVRVRFAPTAKNEPMRAFLESAPEAVRAQAGPVIDYSWRSSALLELRHRPGHDPQEVLEAARSEGKKKAAPSPAPVAGEAKSRRYGRIAREFRTAAAILEAVGAADRKRRALAAPALPAANDAERRLLALWQEVLDLDGVGVEDDYFELGGTSLQAARLFAEIQRRFDRQLPLTTVLTARTIRQLAVQVLQPAGEPPPSNLVLLRDGTAAAPALFLVHDGDGETLLYRNLARRCPDGVRVFGIQPRAALGVPLAHTTIPAMARFYVQAIRRAQPAGPYFLGGMCAGGTIALEMARQLEVAGAEVGHAFVLDAAAPDARRVRGLVSRRRWQRFAGLFEVAPGAPRGDLLPSLAAAAGKVRRAIRHEVESRSGRAADRILFRLLGALLRLERPWPARLPPWSVRRIFDLAQDRHRPGPLERAPVLLVRATVGSGSDEAYRRIFSEEDLGWRRFVRGPLAIVDVAGGHASMLQEPNVADLAGKLGAILPNQVARRA